MSEHLPRVSVVIPNYNYARFLEQRFQSILDQTYRDFEIIFLDDASTDDSVPLVRDRYARYLRHCVVNTSNTGNPFVQWNRGAHLARGEFIWIAEADDYCAANFLERMLAAISQSPRIGLAHCHTLPVDGNGVSLDDGFYLRYVSTLDKQRWNADFLASGAAEVRSYLGKKNTITNVSGVLFRHQALAAIGYATETMRMCGDWLTYCRLLHDYDVAYVSEPMNFHRQHPTKHTQNSVLDLTYFREFLEVQHYIASAFTLDAAERRAAFNRFLGEWDRLTVSHYGRIQLGSVLELANMAASYYPGLGERVQIALHLGANLAKSATAKWLPA